MSTRFGFVSTFAPTQLLGPAIADQYRDLAGRLITANVAA